MYSIFSFVTAGDKNVKIPTSNSNRLRQIKILHEAICIQTTGMSLAMIFKKLHIEKVFLQAVRQYSATSQFSIFSVFDVYYT